ncbi:Coiled-coil domain-containing protein 124-A [Phytophthora citrophthora]|uniref:Coiled-coil domain-containing protein 124-A n=1 Tax=Phytophthora citrophthora TaxID=4793 RepID=A0AAD9LMR4_9STRA|nr:Coiled-coil domain-containing protein 124-A [Phytophthora citrophthora]
MAYKPRKLGEKTIKFENSFQANKNREQEEPLEAHSLDAALDMLGVGNEKELERHPERRLKAAFKAFEEAKLQQVKEDYPGLKLSQYKHKLREMV